MIASLVASTVVVVIWMRSYVVADSYDWRKWGIDPGKKLVAMRAGFGTGMGGLGLYVERVHTFEPTQIERLRGRFETPSPYRPVGFRSDPNPRYPLRWGSDDGALSSLGLHWRNVPSSVDGVYRRRISMAVPFWLLFAGAMAYPIWRYIAGVLERQREDREALGLCPRCGVPLKSNFTKCPGCDRILAVANEA
jgi:hypothetical protein